MIYPNGRKLLYISVSANSHLDLFQATRQEFGEVIMGTAGTIEIIIGDDNHPATALVPRAQGERNPVIVGLEEVNDSSAVVLSSLAMDEHRSVDFSEILPPSLRTVA